jgi:hypothetical protein
LEDITVTNGIYWMQFFSCIDSFEMMLLFFDNFSTPQEEMVQKYCKT